MTPIHKLKTFGTHCYVKRDDELAFGGSKERKLRSLMPRLKAEGVEEVLALGGARSNNILALAQACAAADVPLTPFLLEPRCGKRTLPEALSQFCAPDRVHWLSRNSWPDALALMANHRLSLRHKAVLLPEGSDHPFAYEGSLSLGAEIETYQRTSGQSFDRVFIDAGSGVSALALILAAGQWRRPAEIHVVMCADISEGFAQRLARMQKTLGFETLTPAPYQLLQPLAGRSFGSNPRAVKDEIAKMAQDEGILVDHLYSGKLFLTARSLILPNSLDLLVHSGVSLYPATRL